MGFLLITILDGTTIFILGLACYLSFEHWRFPDLAIDGSFYSGICAVYFLSTDVTARFHSNPILAAAQVTAILLIPTAVALSTFVLHSLSFPPLFSGLVVMLATYTLNFYLNGNNVSQSVIVNQHVWSQPHRELFQIATAMLLALVVIIFDRSNLGQTLRFARRTKDMLVAESLQINVAIRLLIGMCVYNYIAFVGGITVAIVHNVSSVKTIGAIMPGLSCMFFVRGLRLAASSPSTTSIGRSWGQRVSTAITRWSDELWFIVGLLVLASFVVALARLAASGVSSQGLALLNASTAIFTAAAWIVIMAVTRLLGRQVQAPMAS